ncbi:MAG TPA: cellulose binding domain-containing protein [Trebonia sp.]|nr:cellulose binding domain-containing protein [Trebonia sp.]
MPSNSRKLTALAAAATVVAAMTAAAVQARPALAASTATINGGTTFQTITGFGASEAFGEAATVMDASSSVQQQALGDLYSPTTGAGLDILRNEVSADSGDTIEPTAPSSPSATPSYASLASINQDMGQLWFAQQIKADYGVTNVFADAWSAPAFMKTNDSPDNGGAVCGVSGATCSSGSWVQAYANYLKQYAADYAAAGDPLTYIGPENEANLSTSYDSMQLSPAQTVNILDALGPTMASSGLSTQVECCATEGWDYAQQYAAAIEADSTANADTPVFTSHGYTQAPTTPLSGWTKPAWETEWSTFESWDPAWDDGTDASGLTWAQHIFAGLDSANLNAFLYWWGSTTPSENGDNEGLIEINGSTVIPSGRLWAFGNFSRYVRPGAVRIGATTSDGNLTLDAFKNTNGTITVVALETGTSSDPVTFSLAGTGVANGATVTPYLTNSSSDVAAQATTTVSGGSFSYTMPARSLVTFQIPASGGGGTGNTVTVTNPGSQTGTVGTAASLQAKASDSGSGQTLTYSASGLPAGLSINSATGLISGTPTTAGTATVTVTATDGTGATGSATFTWTISSSGGGGSGACTVTYATISQWTGGFTASVTIDAGSSAINGWTLKFTFPGNQQITNAWNGAESQSGENVTISNESYNANIPAGGSTSLGFQGTWSTSDAVPTSFTVNGTACGT